MLAIGISVSAADAVMTVLAVESREPSDELASDIVIVSEATTSVVPLASSEELAGAAVSVAPALAASELAVVAPGSALEVPAGPGVAVPAEESLEKAVMSGSEVPSKVVLEVPAESKTSVLSGRLLEGTPDSEMGPPPRPSLENSGPLPALEVTDVEVSSMLVEAGELISSGETVDDMGSSIPMEAPIVELLDTVDDVIMDDSGTPAVLELSVAGDSRLDVGAVLDDSAGAVAEPPVSSTAVESSDVEGSGALTGDTLDVASASLLDNSGAVKVVKISTEVSDVVGKSALEGVEDSGWPTSGELSEAADVGVPAVGISEVAEAEGVVATEEVPAGTSEEVSEEIGEFTEDKAPSSEVEEAIEVGETAVSEMAEVSGAEVAGVAEVVSMVAESSNEDVSDVTEDSGGSTTVEVPATELSGVLAGSALEMTEVVLGVTEETEVEDADLGLMVKSPVKSDSLP